MLIVCDKKKWLPNLFKGRSDFGEKVPAQAQKIHVGDYLI
jgi:hypothetical protein